MRGEKVESFTSRSAATLLHIAFSIITVLQPNFLIQLELHQLHFHGHLLLLSKLLTEPKLSFAKYLKDFQKGTMANDGQICCADLVVGVGGHSFLK